MVSTSSASQRTLDDAPCAPAMICTRPRYDVRPPPRATDLEMMLEWVFGAAWTILAPARAMDRVSPLECSPRRKTTGYFIVTLEPMLPSIHSIVAPSAQVARLVTRL